MWGTLRMAERKVVGKDHIQVGTLMRDIMRRAKDKATAYSRTLLGMSMKGSGIMERGTVTAGTHMLMAMFTRDNGRIISVMVEGGPRVLVDLLVMRGSTRTARGTVREEGHTPMELSMKGSGRMADETTAKRNFDFQHTLLFANCNFNGYCHHQMIKKTNKRGRKTSFVLVAD